MGLNVRFTTFSPSKSVAATGLYSYREEVIFEMTDMMTDMEKNMNPGLWPSRKNIVNFPSHGVLAVWHRLTLEK